MDINIINKTFEMIMNNPYILVFAALWIIGFLIKSKVKFIPNGWIPTILVFIGAVLGWFIIAKAFSGIVVGCIMAYIIIAFYEQIKGLFEANVLSFILKLKK